MCLISDDSGLTNMHFMSKNTSVLELSKEKTNPDDFQDLALWHLASGLGINYSYQKCSPTDRNEDMYFADLSVDLNMLERNVEQMLKLA